MMEGVTFDIMANIGHLEAEGFPMKSLYATGGGASSHVWLQIKADILNRPITALNAKEVGVCGTCMLCAVALGEYSDLFEAKKAFVKVGKTYYPNPGKQAKYTDLYHTYCKIYEVVRPLMEELK